MRGGDGCDDFASLFGLSFERIHSVYQLPRAKQGEDSVDQEFGFNGSVVPVASGMRIFGRSALCNSEWDIRTMSSFRFVCSKEFHSGNKS